MSDRYIPTHGEIDGAVASIESDRRALLRFASAEPEYDGTGFSRLDMTGADLAWFRSGRAPMRLDHYHNTDSLVGVVEAAWIADDEAQAIVRFGTSPRACTAWNDVQVGVLTSVSLGYSVKRSEVTPEGVLHTEWEPDEVSLVWAPKRRGARVLRRYLTNAERLALLVERDKAEAALAQVSGDRLAEKLEAATHAPWWRRWAEAQAPALAAAAGGDADRLAPVLARAVEAHLDALKELPR